MNPHYNRNHTKKEIVSVLEQIKTCVSANRYTISQNENRQENIDFINEYQIRSRKQSSILMQMEPDDFCYSLYNTKTGYEHEILYVFVPQVRLYHVAGMPETVDIYIKCNLIAIPGRNHTVIISFHRCKKPVDYLFR